MKYSKSVLNDFNKMIKDSLKIVEGYSLNEISDSRFYYEKDYATPIIDYYKITGRKSNEFNKVRGHDDLSICSVASSGRLCFLKLIDHENIKFEWHELNGTSQEKIWTKPSINDAQYDAFDGTTFFECKCQEILNEHVGLSKDYIPVLKDFFGLNFKEENGLIIAKASDFLIDVDKDYRELHFDLKQLFTHLCGIVKAYGNVSKHTLKYIFFKPKEELINKHELIKSAYKELDNELSIIQNSVFFKEKCHIKFEYKYVHVDEDRFAIDPKVLYKKALLKE